LGTIKDARKLLGARTIDHLSFRGELVCRRFSSVLVEERRRNESMTLLKWCEGAATSNGGTKEK
jgi:hypothetical protein